MSRVSYFKLKNSRGAGSRISYEDETDIALIDSLTKRWGSELEWVKVGDRFLELKL